MFARDVETDTQLVASVRVLPRYKSTDQVRAFDCLLIL